ncbi:DUF1826 domain-containing protein [Aliikangiella marina]|uniref:DUF1826 domain-containing protein n=1 Tax=Aliikangiella marina TaxID=1712262 RepID=A0A545T1I9_9GAMM|nr:DUF1826 domain-containing protein [Aliikangiella marina]TQV71082.1 DUF1826 domain-containing protein [Aliikangiella marina]
MIAEAINSSENEPVIINKQTITRQSVQSEDIEVLADIYRDEVNLVVWQRELSSDTQSEVGEFLKHRPQFQKSMTLGLQNMGLAIRSFLGTNDYQNLNKDIVELVDMYCCLFDLKRVGLRLTVLDKAMCPKFHVDRVPTRLICTYYGEATEWLANEFADRAKLGHGSSGLADHESGLFDNINRIQQLTSGDVALLKGELWPGNENAGLIHRSPTLSEGDKRLLLTMDFV